MGSAENEQLSRDFLGAVVEGNIDKLMGFETALYGRSL